MKISFWNIDSGFGMNKNHSKQYFAMVAIDLFKVNNYDYYENIVVEHRI